MEQTDGMEIIDGTLFTVRFCSSVELSDVIKEGIVDTLGTGKSIKDGSNVPCAFMIICSYDGSTSVIFRGPFGNYLITCTHDPPSAQKIAEVIENIYIRLGALLQFHVSKIYLYSISSDPIHIVKIVMHQLQ
jgi:hypothetical protein